MPKTETKELSLEQLKEELKTLQSSKETKKLTELAKTFSSLKKWDLALDSIQYIAEERERNLLITDLIEQFLLPAKEIDQAKHFAKYLTPSPEIQPLVLIRIALAERDKELAVKIAEHLPSPLARNYAYIHILESLLADKDINKISRLNELIKENARTIFDIKCRSYVLRELAVNLYLANNDKERAKEIASLIPDQGIRTQVINKIR